MVQRVLVLIAGFMLLAGPVWGESVAEFYKGKTLRIVVGLGPGGATDTNSRLISHVLSRHIPGNPRIIVQNKPGGGSMLAANTVYNNEPQDGTVLAAISSALVAQQARGERGVRFDARKFQWVASAFDSAAMCAIRTDAGVNNFSEAVKTKKRLTFSAFSKGGLSHLEPVIFNAVFGSNLKAVTGYPSGGAQRLAVKNGEVNGFCTTFQTVKSTEIAMFEGDAKCCKVMIIAGNQKIDHRLAKGVPIAELLAKELGKSESDIAMLRVLNATNRISIVQTFGPGVPKDRVQALRDAYEKSYKDPDLVKLAKKAGMDLKPKRGEQVQEIVNELLSMPKSVLMKMKDLISKS